MPRHHPRARIAGPPRNVAPGAIAEGLAILGSVALALWAYRFVLAGFFSPDDLVLLERARGIAPWPSTPWRWLSGHFYFDLTVPIFAADPTGYLAINWLLHGLNVALVYAFARRIGLGPAFALLAACLFGGSRLFLAVVGQVVGFGDLFALTLTLATCIAVTFAGRLATAASIVSFGLALLSKETVMLVPLALLVAPTVAGSWRSRALRLLPLGLVGLVWMGYLVLSGIGETSLGGPAYARAFGLNLVKSLSMFAEWSVDLWSVAPDYAVESPGWGWGGGLLMVAGAIGLTAGSWRRSPAVGVGLAWWILGLLPLLPLLWQKHLHYLYAPAVGFAIWVASVVERLLDTVVRRRPLAATHQRAVLRWGAVVLLVALHTSVSQFLLEKRYRLRLADVDLPADTFLRKAELIRRVSAHIGPTVEGRRTRLVFFNPQIRGGSDFYANLLPRVLDGGRGLRALFPAIDSVAFVSRWTPGYSDFEIVVANEDGRVEAFGRGAAANLRLVRALSVNGYHREAGELLAASLAAYPTDEALRAQAVAP